MIAKLVRVLDTTTTTLSVVRVITLTMSLCKHMACLYTLILHLVHANASVKYWISEQEY